LEDMLEAFKDSRVIIHDQDVLRHYLISPAHF